MSGKLVELPPVIDLGGPAQWAWLPGGSVPYGVIIDHGSHRLMVPWIRYEGVASPFTLDSLLPLTLVEPVTCGLCGRVGRIKGGCWLPEGGGARG